MNKLKILYVLVVFAAVFAACKDKKEPDPVKQDPPKVDPKTQQEYLSASKWKITALTSSAFGDVWNNPAFIKACNQDNTYNFKLSNIVTTYDTPTKCNVSDPDSTSGPYALISGNKKLYLKMLVGSVQIDDTTNVEVLDASTLKLNFNYSGIPGVVTFTH